MTKLFEQAIDAARTLSPQTQDDIARVVLQLAGGELLAMSLTEEEKISFEKSRDEAKRREFASDDEVKSIWAKHGL